MPASPPRAPRSIAFFDDDVRVAPDWIETILRLFAEHPELECFGGKVLPDWSCATAARG